MLNRRLKFTYYPHDKETDVVAASVVVVGVVVVGVVVVGVVVVGVVVVGVVVVVASGVEDEQHTRYSVLITHCGRVCSRMQGSCRGLFLQNFGSTTGSFPSEQD